MIMTAAANFMQNIVLTVLKSSKHEKNVDFANSVDSDEAAHNELPHLVYTVCPVLFEFSV